MKLLLTTILNLQGYEISTTDNLDKKEFSQNQPAIIILDAGTLEEMNGLELCRQIKQDEQFNRTKIIITSIVHDKELVLSSGADLYIPKPFEIPNLIRWVELFIKEINN